MISPYRNPLFNALSRAPGIHLRVIHLCRRDRREWDLHLDEIEYPFTILSHRGLRQEGLTWGGLLPRRMTREEFDLLVVPGYAHPAYLQAILLGRALGKKVVLWSGSTAVDRRSGGVVREYLKRRVVGLCDGFLAYGSAAREYLLGLGASPERTYIVPNVVQTELFREGSERYGGDRELWRRRLGLPRRVVLFVGRLERWKGIGDLLTAYRGLAGRDQVGLVLVGSGPRLDWLRRLAICRGWPNVFLPGFVERDRLPLYYATADIFVHPSWHDSWGLVVNEAMASGLPVVVSSAAGSARDLVQQGENGFVYPARDVRRLRESMETLLSRPELRSRMGDASRRMIRGQTPEASARKMARALSRIGGRTPEAMTA